MRTRLTLPDSLRHYATAERDLSSSFADTIQPIFAIPGYVGRRVDFPSCADATRWLVRSRLPNKGTHEWNPHIFGGPYSICLTKTAQLFSIRTTEPAAPSRVQDARVRAGADGLWGRFDRKCAKVINV